VGGVGVGVGPGPAGDFLQETELKNSTKTMNIETITGIVFFIIFSRVGF
jgi:hypothetical protein